ncbi:MAG: flippase activity-associated protein Agl23 [Halobacteriales archaeon]
MTGEAAPSAARDGTIGRLRGLLATGRFGLGPRAWQALLAITTVALLARLAGLGYRPMHFDEARVAYWALRYAETGYFEYRSIIHGPFVQHVDRWLFVLVGANDFVARLPVAVVGGLLPLSALLYRDHLRDSELVGLGALFAVSPVLLYYSRFMRSDVLVAAFMFVALGALLRLGATRRPRYLYLAAAFLALGFASKENAAVYVVAWLGAAALVVDTGLYRPRRADSGVSRLTAGVRRLREDPNRTRALLRRWGGHGLGAAALLFALALLLFAPRGGAAGGVGLGRALTAPAMVPDLLSETAWDVAEGFGRWFGGAAEPHCRKDLIVAGYACFLGRFLETMLQFAAPLSLLAVAGFLRERYAAARSRNLVMFATYWGVASVLGYPLGMDIWAAWPVTHALVPLAVPAAVALGALLRAGADVPAAVSRSGADLRGALKPRSVAAVLLAVLLVGYSGAVAVEASYFDARERDGETDMVQYAQPSGDMRPGLRAMRAAVAGNEGLDVLYYGDRYYLADETVMDRPPVPWSQTGAWFDRLPLPWYTEAFDASVRSVDDESALDRALQQPPPVVVTEPGDADAVAARLDGYERYRYDLRAHLDGPGRGTTAVIFVERQP